MDRQGLKIFFSVGEPSGDLHGANLIRALRDRYEDVAAVGFGGPGMAKAGCSLHLDLTKMAFMWWDAVFSAHKFIGWLRETEEYFEHQRPDAVVLIDYPGFNWHVAKRAKRHGIPVFYYTPPQLWAWGRHRLKKMRATVDHVLCTLPFEQDFYASHGLNATYVGHPYFDEVTERELDEAFVQELQQDDRPLITLLPGSRQREVTTNLPVFRQAAERVAAAVPNVRFAVAAFNEDHAELARVTFRGARLPIQVHVARTPELIHAAHSCLACSGSVSLELMYHEKPTVIHYRCSRLGYLIQSQLRKVKYITLVNLLGAADPFTERLPWSDSSPLDASTDDLPFPEYLTHRDRSDDMARELIHWLTNAADHRSHVDRLRELKQSFCTTGSTDQAANYILSTLDVQPHAVPPSTMVAGSVMARVPQVPRERDAA